MFCHYPILSQGIKLVRIFKDLSASYYNMPMEWLTTIKDALQYIEDHLLEVEGADELASHLAISSSYLQQGFQIMTEHTISEFRHQDNGHRVEVRLRQFGQLLQGFHEISRSVSFRSKERHKAPQSILPHTDSHHYKRRTEP